MDSVSEALNEAPLGMFHVRAAVVSGMGFFTDAYDLFIIGIATVLLKPEWHLTAAQISLVTSSTLMAAFFGAMIFGRLADIGGRKRIYWMVSAIMCVGAIASAFSPNLGWLIASRAVLGLAVGGDYPVSAVMMSEYANTRDRGKLVGLVFSMQALGLVVGPIVGLTLVASGISHDLAWRLMLGFGALPAAAVVYLRIKTPESPRYFERVKAQGGIAALQIKAFSNGAVDVNSTSPSSPTRKLGLRDIFTNRRLLLTLIGTAGTWFIFDYAYYGNTISTPLIMKDIAPHAALETTLAWTLIVFAVFAVPGYVLALLKMDRIGHRRLQLIGFSIMAAAFLAIGLIPGIVHETMPFLLLYGLSYFFAEFGPNTTTFVLPAELFPDSVRTTGHGISAGVAKLGAFIGVFAFPVISRNLGLNGTLLMTSGFCVLGILLTRILPETAGKSLEQITTDHETRGSGGKIAVVGHGEFVIPESSHQDARHPRVESVA